MNEASVIQRYADYINSNILQTVDYDKLQASYGTDMAYAKAVLNSLHNAMVKVYGSEHFDDFGGDDGFVMIPGMVRGQKTGNMAVVLLDIDLSSSGEHYGTTFLCGHGVVSQSDIGKSPAADAILKSIGSYDYCYTATIPDDIHVDNSRLPKELKAVLDDFQNHSLDAVVEKPSVLDEIRSEAKTPKNGTPKAAKEKTADKGKTTGKDNKGKSTKKKSEPEH